MDTKMVYKDIQKLETPVGEFTVTGESENISFSVYKNEMNFPHEVTDENGLILGQIQAETNYRIEIDAKSLKIGREYRIQFSDGIWEYCDSDERTTCYCSTIHGWVVGIGAFDPNADEKDRQMWNYSKEMGFLEKGYCQEPPQYDQSVFRRYTAEALDSLDGYRFQLFDDEAETVSFEVAWIKIESYAPDEYETALSLWLC